MTKAPPIQCVDAHGAFSNFREGRRTMLTTARPMLLACLIACLCAVMAGPIRGQSITDNAVTPGGEAKFKQERALAHLTELEGRMFRLAELIRDGQPDDASRLVLAVETARDQLVAERMATVTTLLASLDLDQAQTEQREILLQLEELKRILLTADLDLELKLKELKLIKEAIKKIDELIDKETQQANQTGELKDKPEKATDPMLDLLENDERRNQRAADDVKSLIDKLGQKGANAAGQCSGAGQAMSSAADNLDKKDPNQANKNQQEAIEKLRQARNDLDQQRKELEDQVENLAKKQIIQNLNAMLTQQVEIDQTLEGLLQLDPANASERILTAAQRLATAEDAITTLAEQTIELAETTGFSIALPAALSTVRDRMVTLSDDLRTAAPIEGSLALGQRIETELKELIDAMNLASKKPQNRQPGPQGERARQQEKKFNAMLAELRMLRMMQAAVTEKTIALDEARAAGDIPAVDLRVKTHELRTLQDAVRDATLKLDKLAKENPS